VKATLGSVNAGGVRRHAVQPGDVIVPTMTAWSSCLVTPQP
jgi:hypothetical protein